jgi:hypothetical protein
MVEQSYVRFDINNKKAAFRQGECPCRHEHSTEGIIYISSKFWQSLQILLDFSIFKINNSTRYFKRYVDFIRLLVHIIIKFR